MWETRRTNARLPRIGTSGAFPNERLSNAYCMTRRSRRSSAIQERQNAGVTFRGFKR